MLLSCPLQTHGQIVVQITVIILNECDTMCDVSVHDICRVWQAGLSNVTISNVNILSEMLDIRNGFKTCNILDDDGVNCIITDITVF